MYRSVRIDYGDSPQPQTGWYDYYYVPVWEIRMCMPSNKIIGAAPLIAGTLVRDGFSLWSVPGFVGGCAAIIVGLGILREWDGFHQESQDDTLTMAFVLGLATIAFVAGVVLVLV